MKSPERMSWKELLAAEAQIARAMTHAKQREREVLLEQMAAIAAQHGLTLREVFA